jgi:hypothetical protein
VSIFLDLWIHVAMLCNEFMSLLQSLLHGAEITVFMYACRVMYFLPCHLLISLL